MLEKEGCTMNLVIMEIVDNKVTLHNLWVVHLLMYMQPKQSRDNVISTKEWQGQVWDHTA